MNYPVKSATLKHPDGRDQVLLLVRLKKEEYRWQLPTGQLWEPCSTVFQEEGIAMHQLRFTVESDPSMVGVGLTIRPMTPPPQQRLAKKLITRYAIPTKLEEEMAEIIDRETNISALLDKSETLLAYVFGNRFAYAAAICPFVKGQTPRDMTLEGLLLEFIEEIEKAKEQKFDGLKKALSEPVSAIIVPGKGRGPAQ